MTTELENLVRSYREACGVDCQVFDKDQLGQAGGCRFCRAMQHALPGHRSECSKAHQYGAYQAERFGGKYIYFCPNNLLHWSIPLTVNAEVQAVVVGGPVLLLEPEEMLTDLKLKGLDQLEDELRLVPYLQPARATALAEVLYRLVAELRHRLAPEAEPQPLQRPTSWYPDTGAELPPTYPFEKEKELIALLSNGNHDEARALVNDILGHVFFFSGQKIATVRLRAQELLVLLSRAAVEGGASAEEVFGISENWMQRLQLARSIDDLETILARVVRRFADCMFVLKAVKHADIIQKAVRYIRLNYAQKLSLEAVAAQVYLSPSYFSRVFKEELKTSFVAFLSDVRIEKSKRLLADRSIPLVVVAGLVGFEDQSYFNRVFKKVTGQSPGKFRQAGNQQAGGS
ncbi:MAG: helix-turn-helix domain-containing protein [Spirochaetales bacterium]